MPIWVKLDAMLCLSVGFLLKLSGHGILLLAGAGYLGLVMYDVFEYGDGLFDISTLEVIALLLFATLIYRHYSYCKRFDSSLWTSVSRPLYAFGWLALIVSVPLLTYAIIQSELGRPNDFIETSEVKMLEWFFTLVVLYLSAPCALKPVSKQQESFHQENSQQENKPQFDTPPVNNSPDKEPNAVKTENVNAERVQTATVSKPVTDEQESVK